MWTCPIHWISLALAVQFQRYTAMHMRLDCHLCVYIYIQFCHTTMSFFFVVVVAQTQEWHVENSNSMCVSWGFSYFQVSILPSFWGRKPFLPKKKKKKKKKWTGQKLFGNLGFHPCRQPYNHHLTLPSPRYRYFVDSTKQQKKANLEQQQPV